jgi:DivIVA domain-containing protein
VTPEDVRNREFMIALRGYDKDDVRQFLQRIADAIERAGVDILGDDRSGTTEDGAAGTAEETRYPEFAELAGATERILEAAERSARDMVAHAREQAHAIEARAAERYAALIDEGRQDAAARMAEVERRLAEAEAAQEQVERERALLERERLAHEHEYARAVQAIRDAGRRAQQLMLEAAAPSGTIVETIAEARRLVAERFERTTDEVNEAVDRSVGVAEELVAELTTELAPDHDRGRHDGSTDVAEDGVAEGATADDDLDGEGGTEGDPYELARALRSLAG